MTERQQAADSRVADLVRAGKVRVALYVPQYTKDPVSGELRGWPIDLVQALGECLGVEGVPVEHDSPSEALASLTAGRADAAIIGIDPSRQAVVEYAPPLIEADFTCLVPAGSSARSIADVDIPGARIAAVRNHASTMALSRMLKHADVVGADMLDPAFELLRHGEADAFASLREVLLDYAQQLPGARVLEQRYGFNRLAFAVPKGQASRLAYLSEFTEHAKASGLVQRAIDRAGWRGAQVAPPADRN